MIPPARAWLTLLRDGPEEQGVRVLFDSGRQNDVTRRQKAFYEALFAGAATPDGSSGPAPGAAPAGETLVNRLWRRARQRKEDRSRRAVWFASHLDRVLAETPPGRRARVVEIGCSAGTALSDAALARQDRIEYVGIDLAFGPLAALRRRFDTAGASHFALVCDDFLADNLAAGAWDALYALSCVHHFDAAGKAAFAAKTTRLLRPGGRAAFVEALDINPLLMLLRRATRPWRPNLAWEHPFSLAEIDAFLGAFAEARAEYFEGLRAFALAAGFHQGLMRRLAGALDRLDARLARRRACRRLFTGAFFSVRTAAEAAAAPAG